MKLDNYPIGAENDPSAPYNEKTELREFYTSVIISKPIEVEVSKDKENVDLIFDLKKSIEEEVQKQLPEEWIIDSIAVIKEN